MKEVPDREMDGEGGAGPAELGELLARRHGAGLHGGAGQDDRLGDLGQGELQLEAGGGGGIGGDAGQTS